MNNHESLPGATSILGPYDLLQQIGAGGMGVVYQARHRGTGQIVAIKVMGAEPAKTPLLAKRFEQECAVARRLRHPHIVQGLDFGVGEGRPYLVMEYVDGQSLGERLRKSGALPQDLAIRIGIQVADALQSAHHHHLIHRDVKPDNILLTKDCQSKLTDLGLIKDMSAGLNLTMSHMTLGTIAYAAPEQFEDAKKVDLRSDIYALAACLYHALTGSAPFQGRVASEVLTKKFRNKFDPPKQLVPALPRRINTAICKALDVSPDNRPRSCTEFIAPFLVRPQGSVPIATESPALDRAPDPEPLPAGEERRAGVRYPSALEVLCRTHVLERAWSGHVQDISLTGVLVRLQRRFEPGTNLTLKLLGPLAKLVSSVDVRVCWVRRRHAQAFDCGCQFSCAMSKSDLNLLLGNPPETLIVQQKVTVVV